MFFYAARTFAGERVNGSLVAESRVAAGAHLRARDLVVTSLEPQASATGALATLQTRLAHDASARRTFFRCFAMLLGAGVAVRRALAILSAQAPAGAFRQALASVEAEVEAGRALSDAMARQPLHFSALSLKMIEAGELAGSLDEALRAIVRLEERDRDLRRRLQGALAYPAVLVVAAVALVLFLVAAVMPSFATMFAQMRVPLPLVTRLLIALGHLLATPTPWALGALAIAGGAAAVYGARSSPAPWAVAIDGALLKTPVFGSIVRRAGVARFCRTLGTLLGAGVPVDSALAAACGVASGAAFRARLARMQSALASGDGMAAPFAQCDLFDDVVVALVRIGEESGSLDAMLLRVADEYEADVEHALVTLTSMIEPALILLLGGAVGTIVASTLIPLYSMIGAIR